MIYIILSLFIFIYVDARYDGIEYLYRTKGIFSGKFGYLKLLLLIASTEAGFIVGREIYYTPYYYNMEIFTLVKITISYLLFRFCLFNLIFNLTAKLPWDFIGTTKFLDKLQHSIAKILKISENPFWTIIRILFFIIGFLILFI